MKVLRIFFLASVFIVPVAIIVVSTISVLTAFGVRVSECMNGAIGKVLCVFVLVGLLHAFRFHR